jgi:hypothetical protein
MQSLQPMHLFSSITATVTGFSSPFSGFNGIGSIPSRSANAVIPALPPGGHWLIPASPAAIASAYGRQPG